MNQESANALLKILEEPPPQTLYFLTTSQFQGLLPTIISRCQLVKLQKIQPEQIESGLVQMQKAESADARMVAKLADGNYATALQLLSGDLKNKRELMIQFLIGIVGSHSSSVADAVDILLTESKKDKAFILEILSIMSTWFQDSFYISHVKDDSSLLNSMLINHDKIERIEKFIRNFPRTNVDLALTEIEKAVDLISRNIYLNLILINLGLNLRKIIFNSKTD